MALQRAPGRYPQVGGDMSRLVLCFYATAGPLCLLGLDGLPSTFRCRQEQNSFNSWCVLYCTGDAIPLEYNLDALHGISYDKGCYVGQELIARTHWSGAVRKRLMPFALHPSAGVLLSSTETRTGNGNVACQTASFLSS